MAFLLKLQDKSSNCVNYLLINQHIEILDTGHILLLFY